MKANRKFIKDGEAVSAVIGVILMVAITVAIAATVFYYVQNLATEPGESKPTIQIAVDESNDRLEITSCDSGVKFSDFTIKSSAAVTVAINEEATADAGSESGQAIAADGKEAIDDSTWGTDWNADVEAADYIDIEGTAAALSTQTTITLIHSDSNAVIGEYIFNTIAQIDS